MNYQHRFFQVLKLYINSHNSFADEIAEVLNISKDSTYRRLRGETSLTLDETVLLCNHFNIPPSEVFSPAGDIVLFKKVSIAKNSCDFQTYLETTLKQFEFLYSGQEKSGWYAARDIPVFYFFMFPELCEFKVFFWLKNIKEVSEYKNLQFSFELIPKDIIKLCTNISRIYSKIPFIEIWNEETGLSTVRQIDYAFEAGIIQDKNVAILLFEQLLELVSHVKQQAEGGQKYWRNENSITTVYELYYNEILLLDNTILTKRNRSLLALVSYNAIDYITTSDPAFCDDVMRWMNIQMERSYPISKTAEKERNKFFSKIQDRIKVSINKYK